MLTSEIDIKKFKTLIEITELINSEYTDIKALLTKIVKSACLLAGAESASLLLHDNESNKLFFEIAIGPKGEDVKKYSINLGEGIAGWVAQKNTSLIVNDVDSDNRFFSKISENIEYKTKSILAVPMRLKSKCVGVIEVINKHNEMLFTNEDLEWLEIFSTQASLAIQNAKSYDFIKNQVLILKDEILEQQGYHTFIGASKAIKEKLDMAHKIAKSDSSALILGESGTGKELFAEQIHFNSNRKNNPFIKVNCAAIPENLLESELFGHVRGAYTGAENDRKGRFELADTGTLFLDEIGDMPITLQAKLLRILQNKSFEKLGSEKTISVDVRIIAASNKNIEELVEQGKFRKDLYYRLNVLPIYVPPLRERKEDISILSNYFLNKISNKTKKNINNISNEALTLLENYSWPGNIRELENIIERAVVNCNEGNIINSEHIILNNTSNNNNLYDNINNLKDAVNIFKKQFIIQKLRENNWKQTKTAQVLEIQRTYLSRLIKELDIKK